MNRLFSKRMSNIYLKVTIETFSKLRFSGFKKFVTRSVLGSSNSRRYHGILKLLVASDCNWARTHSHLVGKRTLNHFAKLVVGRESSYSHLTSDFALASSKEFLDIQATIECGFTLKRVRDI